jgi:hypothetical protein
VVEPPLPPAVVHADHLGRGRQLVARAVDHHQAQAQRPGAEPDQARVDGQRLALAQLGQVADVMLDGEHACVRASPVRGVDADALEEGPGRAVEQVDIPGDVHVSHRIDEARLDHRLQHARQRQRLLERRYDRGF